MHQPREFREPHQPHHEPIAPPTEKTAVCKTCGQSFFFESQEIFGIEFGNIRGLCPSCETAAAAEEARAKEEARRAENEARIASIIPEDLRDTNVYHPDFNRALWNDVRRWRPCAASYWLGITGRAGRCKTRCMALLAMQAMRYGIRVAWTTSHRIKDAAADRRHQESAISMPARAHLDEITRAPWLFIDDLGKATWTDAFESALFCLLDHRKVHRLATVFSSNVGPNELALNISAVNQSPIIGRLQDRSTIIEISA